MDKTFGIFIEPNAPLEVRTALRDTLTTDLRVLGWWNHLPGLYLITSDSNAADLSDMVSAAARPWSFLVIKVDPTESQGWLPDRAWKWIQLRYA